MQNFTLYFVYYYLYIICLKLFVLVRFYICTFGAKIVEDLFFQIFLLNELPIHSTFNKRN